MRTTIVTTSARVALAGVLAVGIGGGTVTVTSPAQAVTPVAAISAAPAATPGIAAYQGMAALRIASTKRGKPYRWGATGPNAFDCSGYTTWVFKRIGKRLARTADSQYRATTKISRRQARPGDLVFFGRGYKYHVGIYAGSGRIWHSPRPGKTVTLAKIWSKGVSYGRVR